MSSTGEHHDLPDLDRRLTTPTSERWGSRLRRRRLAPAVAVAALGSVLVAAPVAAQVVDESPATTDTTAPDTTTTDTTAPDASTTTTADPFDAGVPVTDVVGDSTTTAPPNPSTMKIEGGKVKDVRGDGVNVPAAAGDVELPGANGLVWYLNDDITQSTTSSASGAMSEASFLTPVTATTIGGGTSITSLTDAFDGYNNLCVDINGETGECSTDTSGLELYYDNGPATLECSGESAVFGVQNLANGPVADLDIQRRVYVPSDGQFARWLNTFTNNDAAPTTFEAIVHGNLGSDNDTIITGSSAGGAVNASVSWFGTMQQYGVDSPPGTSYDPRIGHVVQGIGGTLPVDFLDDPDGVGYTNWGYSVTLQPGETITIANFATLSGSKAAANALAASLATNGTAGQWACMTEEQKAEVMNFDVDAVPPTTTTTTTTAAPTTAAPTTAAPAVDAATGTLPYTGAGGELLPLAGAGAALAGTGAMAAAATRRRLRRPGWTHRR